MLNQRIVNLLFAGLTAGFALGFVTLSGAAAQVVVSPAAPATPAGQEPASKPAKKARANIYDEKADGKAQIAAAVAKARKENKRVLVQWGGNWCGWCHLLHDFFKKDAKVARELLYEYEVVLVDIGQFDKNVELAKSLGAKFDGVPYLTVLDADGKTLANQETGSLEKAKGDGEAGYVPERVLDFLKKHEAKPLVADELLKGAIEAAKKEQKSIFLHFGAPWCGWCHRMEAWMARPEVAAAIAKDFVDVKIDIDRAVGGKAMIEGMCKNYGGPPWFVFLGADGKEIVNSMHPEKGNVGFPQEPHEIEWFMGMLSKVKKNMSDADVATLKSTLEEEKNKRGH